MKQLLLDFATDNLPTFDTFVVGQNTELTEVLKNLLTPSAIHPHEHFIYIWGPSGAGKTHLLQALAQAHKARYIPANAPTQVFEHAADTSLYLLDDCDQLSPEAQIDAFALFNEIRAQGDVMISAGLQPPRALALREDLRTRLGWGLIYQIHELTDADKINALERVAQARSLVLAGGVLPYLITHCRRDMPSLSQVLLQLDAYSLETKRPITLPLLRDLLHDLERQQADHQVTTEVTTV
jgi:DnaA family protein